METPHFFLIRAFATSIFQGYKVLGKLFENFILESITWKAFLSFKAFKPQLKCYKQNFDKARVFDLRVVKERKWN